MKNIMFIITFLIFSIVLFTGCDLAQSSDSKVYESLEKESLFEVIQVTDTYFIVYHLDSKVMYSVSRGRYNSGTFTLLVDSNGMPLLYS